MRRRIAVSAAAAVLSCCSLLPLADKPSGSTAEALSPQTSRVATVLPTPAPESTSPFAIAEIPCPWTPDSTEVDALARMLYGEARGIASDMEKAACVWCVLNRVDDPRFHDTVLEVLEAPYQFAGYKADYPVLPELRDLAADVLTRYHAEQAGDIDAGRVLPPEYVFFTGDGKHNYFTATWKSNTKYQWDLANPYDDLRERDSW